MMYQQRKNSQYNWLKNLIAIVLGILLTFAFAPYEIFPLAVLVPAGLLALWLPVSPKRAFWIGFLFGLGFFGSGIYWVYISIHTIGEVPLSLSCLITGGLIAILALFPAVTGYSLNRYFPHTNTTKLLAAFPGLWLFSEWVRSWLFTGFPWLFLGYSQIDSPLKGYASILSVYGVSLAVLLSSALLFYTYQQTARQHYKAVYFSLFSLFVIWILGSLLCLIPWTKPNGRPLSVALVQGNIPQVIKWSPDYLQFSIDRYTQLSEPLWGKTDLIVWPETAIPLPLQNAESIIQTLNEKARDTKTTLLLGIPERASNQQGYYNSLVALSADQTALYRKRRLVPFGEYTPFLSLLSPYFDALNIPLSDLIPGERNQNPLFVDQVEISPAICYEIAYPELTWTNNRDLGFLLTITNDAWFGHSNAQAQHLQMARMRAVELGRPMLFVSNDGITAILNADGSVAEAAPAHQSIVLHGRIQPYVGITPWMYNGIDPILFILLCLLLTAWRAETRAKRSLHQSEPPKVSSSLSADQHHSL